MNSEELRKKLLKYKRNNDETVTHTIIPDLKNKIYGLALHIPSEKINEV